MCLLAAEADDEDDAAADDAAADDAGADVEAGGALDEPLLTVQPASASAAAAASGRVPRAHRLESETFLDIQSSFEAN